MVEIVLTGLSVEELEKLQERVSKEILARLCEQVEFLSFDFEPVDDRSMGRLTFEAKTRHGVLAYEGNLGNGYSDDEEISLDGELLEEGSDCLEVPAFHDNSDSDGAKRDCAKAVLAFETAYAGFLQDA